MFLKHFKLDQDPFGVAPDPSFFYLGPEHAEALASLYYVFSQRRGCGLVLGEAGLGKTVTLRYLRALIRNQAHVVVLSGPMKGTELLRAVAAGLGISGVGSAAYEQRRAIEEVLLARSVRKRRTVLFIDNAEQLSMPALQTLQDICALENSKAKLIDVLMGGNQALLTTLQSPALERLSQRIEVTRRIVPLDGKRTAEYLAHRTQRAGAKQDLFTENAAHLVAAAALGVPRKINALAHASLVCAWSRGADVVNDTIVREVLGSLQVPALNPAEDLHPNTGALVPSHV